jgi:CRP-like cAMP-binding protein
MISPEVLRRWPFFAGLSQDHTKGLARVATEKAVDEGHFFFHEGDELGHFYLVLEGKIDVVIEALDKDVEHKISEQYLRDLKTRDVVVRSLGPGDVFAWSALVAPHEATAGAKAVASCKVVEFDAVKLLDAFEEDCRFGYEVMQKMAQLIRQRLRDTRIESLALVAE